MTITCPVSDFIIYINYCKCTLERNKEEKNNNPKTIVDCYLKFVIGVIAILTIVPILMLFRNHYKKKRSIKRTLLSKKTCILISMIFLNIEVACVNILNLNGIGGKTWLLSSSQYLIMWLLKGIATYTIIFYVFKKVSKLHMNKEKWLCLLKMIFTFSIFGIINSGVLKMIKTDDESYDKYGSFKYKAINMD